MIETLAEFPGWRIEKATDDVFPYFRDHDASLPNPILVNGVEVGSYYPRGCCSNGYKAYFTTVSDSPAAEGRVGAFVAAVIQAEREARELLWRHQSAETEDRNRAAQEAADRALGIVK